MADLTRKRVVITGLGVITPLGQGIAAFWENILAGKCGIGPVTAYDTEGYACTIAGEVKDFDPTPAFPSPKEVRRTDRFTQFAMMAGWEAINDSGLDLAAANCDRIGAFIGSGIGGLGTMEKQHKTLLDRGPGRVSPFFIPMMILNMASGMFSLYNGLRGPNIATCSACATASHAIGEAWRTLVMGDADVMLAGGTEAAINPIAMSGFDSMKAMSRRNDDPQHASRPFDADRDGFVMGEGSGVVMLETLEHAKARGAKIYCEIAGYGNTADAHHMTSPAPGGEGGARAMQAALASGGLNPGDISYINAHGTSTPQGDVCETQAIKTIFGDHSSSLAVSSTKGATGHMLGAAGSVEMAVCCKAIETNTVPPTINYETPDPDCDLDYTPHHSQKGIVNAAMSNNLGFGGHNASLIFKKIN